MKPFSILSAAVVLSLSLFTTHVEAALEAGSHAPNFTLQGALAGKPLTFSLQQALQKGPVVLYFFPAAFSKGCNIEANAFAEATDDFNKLGASVVGVTAGNVEQVDAFSRKECRINSPSPPIPGRRWPRSTRP